MEISKVVDLIEQFAPLKSQEAWDSSGFQVEFQAKDIKKILVCLSITEEIVNQAVEMGCDMLISHHPLFFIPFSYNKGISIYSAHTNLDKADGGTTDTLIEKLGFRATQKCGEFLRFIDLKSSLTLVELVNLIKSKLCLTSLRVVNNKKNQVVEKIAFCAGSGMDFLADAEALGADVFVTGDVKYHQALESNVIIMDVGHFETEYPVLTRLKSMLNRETLEVILADEKSPFINY